MFVSLFDHLQNLESPDKVEVLSHLFLHTTHVSCELLIGNHCVVSSRKSSSLLGAVSTRGLLQLQKLRFQRLTTCMQCDLDLDMIAVAVAGTVSVD